MSTHKKFGLLLKALIILVAACLLVTALYLMPRLGKLILMIYPWMEPRYLPWLIFVSVAEFICLLMLIPAWRISSRIEKGNSFCKANVKDLKLISRLMLIDSVYFIIGAVVLFFLDMNFRTSTLLMFIVFFAGIVISLFAEGLARLVNKGTNIQDENDLTV